MFGGLGTKKEVAMFFVSLVADSISGIRLQSVATFTD